MTKKKQKVKINKNVIISASIALVVLVAGIGMVKAGGSFSWERVEQWAGLAIADKVDVPENFGAMVGPDYYNDFTVHGKLNDGGGITNASTTLTIARALTAKEVCESSIITVNSAAVAATVSAASLDITLPATSTLWTMCLKEEGAHTRFWFANLSPTAASTTQIVAGTGMDLLEAGTGNIFNVEIGGGDRALIEIWRQTGFETGTLDAYATVVEYSIAD